MRPELNQFPKRKSIRLKHYDYSTNGYYFVTICTHQSKRIIDKYEDVIKNGLYDLQNRFVGVRIDYHVLMSSHLHIISCFKKQRSLYGRW